MLTCIACSKQQLPGGGTGSTTLHEQEDDDTTETPRTKQAVKTLSAQIKDIALKASGAYKNCKPCSGSSNQHVNYADSDNGSASERLHGTYRRPGSGSSSSTPRQWGKEMEARLKGLSSGEGTPPSRSGRTESIVLMDEGEPKEWVAQVEPGVLITFVSMPEGGNDLKRIRFSREMFNKWQAQRWWSENYDKVMELYNVQKFNRESVPHATPPRSEDEDLPPGLSPYVNPHNSHTVPKLSRQKLVEKSVRLDGQSSKVESAEDSPVTPPLSKERPPRNFHHLASGKGHSPSDSLDQQPMHSRHYQDTALSSTPKVSNISCSKTETSSVDGSSRTSSEADRSGKLSMSNASDMESEWVEQDEPGVYITIRALPGGLRELRRVRFSREKFGEMHARLWWEENRARIHEQYL